MQQCKNSILSEWPDLNPMTLILKLALDMVKMSHHTKNFYATVFKSYSPNKHTLTQSHTQTHTHTNTQYENITFPHNPRK